MVSILSLRRVNSAFMSPLRDAKVFLLKPRCPAKRHVARGSRAISIKGLKANLSMSGSRWHVLLIECYR